MRSWEKKMLLLIGRKRKGAIVTAMYSSSLARWHRPPEISRPPLFLSCIPPITCYPRGTHELALSTILPHVSSHALLGPTFVGLP